MDWNADGRLDIIVGDRLGNVSYFRRLFSGDIYLIAEPKVKVAGKPISLGHNSAPSVVDWNNDGLPDIVAGRLEGIPTCLYLYINKGVTGAPLFNETDTVFCSGEPIQLYVSYPDFGDMNNDGLQDLILGSSTGRIACYTNCGTADLPVFEEHEDLIADGEVINFYSYIRPSVCDWNEDGIPDILAADYSGEIFLFLGEPATGVEEVEAACSLKLSLNSPAVDLIRASIELRSSAEVIAALYSIDGRLQCMESYGILNSGVHLLHMDIRDIPAGVYLFVSSAGEVTVSRSVVVLD
ncbi:MAG: VCBS repeat-containing protein [Candidatus Aegiribacteria sp.]|nr:VCBS repeat-containing protein [Candidatus Aegiribacteria sp.]